MEKLLRGLFLDSDEANRQIDVAIEQRLDNLASTLMSDVEKGTHKTDEWNPVLADEDEWK